MSRQGEVHINTIILERNRWSGDRVPSYLVGDWLGRFADAGFDGIELWQNHALMADEQELSRLAAADPPVRVFNGYAKFVDSGVEHRRRADELAVRLGADAIKFNLNNDRGAWDSQLAHVRQWRDELDESVTLLCECHPNTLLEEPSAARRFFDQLGSDNWEIIVHPFSRFSSLGAWLAEFGPKVTHAHLQMDTADRGRVLYRREGDLARRAVAMMTQAGFTGSWSLEFTEGIGESENIETLWQNALDDLAFLRELLG
jgi:sugar phosphate isomerase/epimerase